MAMNSHDLHAGSRDLAALAGLLADGTRASFCLALLDGRAWTATELARHAGVAVSTATGQLNLLVAGGLLAEERQGRSVLAFQVWPQRESAADLGGDAGVVPSQISTKPPRAVQ